jgi:hypothetical protein
MPGSITNSVKDNESNKFVLRSDNQVASAVDLGVTSSSTLPVSLYDKGGIPAEVDNSTHSLQIIDYEHHEIHAGSHFYHCDYDLSVTLNNVIEFVFITADTDKLPHLTFDVYSGAGVTIEFYAGASGITGGTTITPRNNRTDSAIASGVTLIRDPSVIASDGTRAAGFLAGAGRTSGFVNRDRELVLSRNTTYLVRITSLANSNSVSWCAEWYEHTDKS